MLEKAHSRHFAVHSGNCATYKIPLIPALVVGIQTAQALELKGSFDPTDVGSLDPRHKGEDEGERGQHPTNSPMLFATAPAR